MIRQVTAAVLALGVVGTTLVPASAQTVPAPQPDLSRVYPGESYAQYYPGPYVGPRPYVRPLPARPYVRPYPGPYVHPYRRDNGAAVAAGVAGLAAGALIAGAIANQPQAAPPPPATVDPQLAAYCARRYRSFDPVTGTFVANSGQRFVCTY